MHRDYQQMFLRAGKDVLKLVILRKPAVIMGQDISLAGLVRSKLFTEDIALVVDYRPCEDRNYEYACAALDSGGHTRVLMEPAVYLDFIRGKPYARTTLLHELGHIYHNDLPEIHGGNAEYDSERLAAIENGTVHEREVRADAFASRFLGPAVVCEGLTVLRKNDIAEDEEANAPSITELTRRIQLLS